VLDANGQALAYIYARDKKADADIAHVLTTDEARRIAVNVARLPVLLGGSNAQTNMPLCSEDGAASIGFDFPQYGPLPSQGMMAQSKSVTPLLLAHL
jgi:hypothetical protein